MRYRRFRKQILKRKNKLSPDQRAHPEKYIPHGMYCYTPLSIEYRKNGMPVMHVRRCPFLDRDTNKPPQLDGYCHYLHSGDWDSGSILWDSCKSCSVNMDFEEDEDAED